MVKSGVAIRRYALRITSPGRGRTAQQSRWAVGEIAGEAEDGANDMVVVRDQPAFDLINRAVTLPSQAAFKNKLPVSPNRTVFPRFLGLLGQCHRGASGNLSSPPSGLIPETVEGRMRLSSHSGARPERSEAMMCILLASKSLVRGSPHVRSSCPLLLESPSGRRTRQFFQERSMNEVVSTALDSSIDIAGSGPPGPETFRGTRQRTTRL
jgi:hypothetical protein